MPAGDPAGYLPRVKRSRRSKLPRGSKKLPLKQIMRSYGGARPRPQMHESGGVQAPDRVRRIPRPIPTGRVSKPKPSKRNRRSGYRARPR